MFRKRRRRIIVLLIVMGVTSLSCNTGYIRKWLCESTGGTWVFTGQLFQGECKRQKNSRTDEGPPSAADQQDIGDSVDQSITDDGEANLTGNEEVPADNQGHIFSSDDCSCSSFSIPLNSSSASNYTYKMGVMSEVQAEVTSEVQVEVTGHLACDWQDDHQSANKTGTIMIYLNVYKFDNAQDAQILFNKFHNNASSMMKYCEKDKSCTVAIAEFGEDRAFYVWKNIYVGGKGELPSDHGANLARLITTAEKYYVLDLLVTHPELEIADTWVSYTAQSVESCVMNIVNR